MVLWSFEQVSAPSTLTICEAHFSRNLLSLCLLPSQYAQIHLSRVLVKPVFRGGANPHFRLSPTFSDHVLLFNVLPIVFIAVSLPFALLDQLTTNLLLASATIKHSSIHRL